MQCYLNITVRVPLKELYALPVDADSQAAYFSQRGLLMEPWPPGVIVTTIVKDDPVWFERTFHQIVFTTGNSTATHPLVGA